VPQARSSGSKSASTSGRSQTKRASASKSAGAKRTTRKTASAKSSASKPRATRASATRKSAGAGTTSARSTNGRANSAGAADPRLDAVAARVRKLNERIIDESKSAGEATLTAYEKALKAIAASLERGPGKSDVEWVSSLATTQAKWIRDVTTAWTAAARGMLK
jgi:hypothetical protein